MPETNTITTSSTEEQITAFKSEVARLQEQVREKRHRDPNYGVIGKTNPQFIEEMFGMFAGDAEAEEVLRSIEEAREREREEARRDG